MTAVEEPYEPNTADIDWLYTENGAARAGTSWQPINLANLPNQPPIQPTLGASITYPGKRHVFSGPQESAKTLAAYAIALEIIQAGAPVIVIDFEMGKWEARNRMLELGYTPENLSQLHYIEPHEPATADRIQPLVDLQPALVIIDAAAGAYDNQGLDDNKRSDVEKFTRLYVRDFWRNNIATIVLDHVVKNVEGRGKYAIGSERKVGGADVHLGFEAITPIRRGGTGIYKITTHKDRGGFLQRGRLADLHLASDPETHRITWEFKPPTETADGGWRPTRLMEKVSRLLELTPTTKSTIYDTVPGKRTALVKAVEILLQEGYIVPDSPNTSVPTVPPGKGTKLRSNRPYREESEEPFPSVPNVPENGPYIVPSVPPPTGGNGNGNEPENEQPPDDDDIDFAATVDDDIPW